MVRHNLLDTLRHHLLNTVSLPLRRIVASSFALTSDQRHEPEEILDSKTCSACGDLHERIGRAYTCPRGRQPHLFVLVEEVDAILTPRDTTIEEHELPTSQGMKRVSDLKTYDPIVGIACTRLL